MATINGVYHPIDSDPYDLTGPDAGGGDLGQLAAAAGQRAADQAAAALATARGYTDTEITAVREHLWQKFRTVPNGTDLNTLNGTGDSGVYGLADTSTYPNNPLVTGTRGILTVVVAQSSGGYQEVVHYGQRWTHRRNMTNYYASPRTWGPWYRTDIDRDAVNQIITDAPQNFWVRGTLPAATDLDTRTGMTHTGMYTIGTFADYTNLPPRPAPDWRGMLVVFSTGVGDTWQRVVWRGNEGVWERYQRDFTGAFTDWKRVDQTGGSGTPDQEMTDRLEAVEGRAELLGAGAPVSTVWELAQLLSTYGAGEAYIERLHREFSDKRGINPAKVRVLDLGRSVESRPVRALELGDATKPALMIMAAQHGDEVSGREAAFLWAREVAESTDPAIVAALSAVCLLVVPTVNVDRVNLTRQNATGSNLNRNWDTRSIPEVAAVASLFGSHDVVAVLDAHEGGWTDGTELAYNDTLPEIHPDVVAAGGRMYTAAWDALVAAGEPVREYVDSSGGGLDRASGNFPAFEGAATLLQENPRNPTNRYFPDLDWRIDLHRIVYNALFLDVAQNTAVYVDAKAASQA